MIWTLKTGPTIEPVTPSELREHLRLEKGDTTDEQYLKTLIQLSRVHGEHVTRRAWITQTWTIYRNSFPKKNYIQLPFGSLQTVNSFSYRNSSGDTTTLTEDTDYVVDTDSEPGMVVLAYGKTWPSFTPFPVNPIAIEITCGYGDSGEDVPQTLRTWMKAVCGEIYENRELTLSEGTPKTIKVYESILLDHKVNGVYE